MSDQVEMPAEHLSQEERMASVHSYRLVGPLDKVGGAFVPTSPDFPEVRPINRIVGEQPDWPASEAELDEALEAVPPGTDFYVAVAGPEPERAGGWLEERGFTPSLGWMGFRRKPEAVPIPATDLRIREARTEEDFSAFGQITASAFGLDGTRPSGIFTADRFGWRVWLALDGDTPVGAAGLLEYEGIGYVGMAGTLEQARGRGAQSALLATRISAAFEAGLDSLMVETGERRPNEVDASYRNILRAGFTEVGITPNWAGQR